MTIEPFDYLLAIQIPVFQDGDRLLYQTDWRRALLLLRQSFGAQVKRLKVVAPTLPADHPNAHILQPADDLGIDVIPSISLQCSASNYWLNRRKKWRADVLEASKGCAIGHFACNDNIRTLDFDAFKVGLRQGLATVFFRDVDERVRIPQAAKASGRGLTLKERLYLEIDDRTVRHCVRNADLSFLKGRSLITRYGGLGKNTHDIVDTSYHSDDVVEESKITARAADITGARPLRLVYCGRLEPIKGVEAGVRIIAMAREMGANVEFDVIGQGSELDRLAALTAELGQQSAIRFLGARSYEPELIRMLSDYDGLLFTPTAEETPRMIFDGYAAGLPLIAYDVSYCVERADKDRAAILLPFNDIEQSAVKIANLDRKRANLQGLAVRALAAGRANAVDVWYKHRAELTLEALSRRRDKQT